MKDDFNGIEEGGLEGTVSLLTIANFKTFKILTMFNLYVIKF